ncbi:PD-(D/E)XK nuclease family protein [Cupriavidus metallidurans]|uniref:PD-(D/E)XK nuclease family protein n=1 Tax=Cupriavidus metallidurans TaxID=119219 RepID=UPI003D74FE80
MEQLAQVLRQIGDLPQMESPELNFYAVGGAGYLENPTSDLMALFMGAEPQAPRWLAKALLSCLANRGLAEGAYFGARDQRFRGNVITCFGRMLIAGFGGT